MKRSISIMSSMFIAFIAVMAMANPSHAQESDATSYSKARSCYGRVKKNAEAERSDWIRCIALFEKVYDVSPGSSDGARALYSAARLRRESYAKYGERNDLLIAIKTYNRVIKDYPKNALADDSLYQVGVLRLNPLKEKDKARRAFTYLIDNYPQSDMVPKAQKMLDSIGGRSAKSKPLAASVTTSAVASPTARATVSQGDSLAAAMASGKAIDPFANEPAGAFDHATLTGIDVESNSNSTIVRLKLNRQAAYAMKFTDVGRRTGSPPVLELFVSYVDLTKGLGKKYEVLSSYLRKFKVKKQLLGSGLSLAFTMEPGSEYDVKSIDNDIFVTFGKVGVPLAAPAARPVKSDGASKAKKSGPLRVVIDPGHGGEDSGAIGPRGTKEKDIVLKIAKGLARELNKKKGVKVYLTRTRDKSLTLDQRNEFARKKKADIFISVHVNASRKRDSRGIETYYLNNATDKAAARLANQENKASGKKLSDVEHILSTMLQNYDAAESAQLAKDIQKSMMGRMSGRYPNVVDRGVRSALFYVLVGAKCPAVLLETSFISNPLEERRLSLTHYRDHLAIGAAQGVTEYLKQRNKRMVSL
jgi:N-acetylmuramoyl-L-alanine amidase